MKKIICILILISFGRIFAAKAQSPRYNITGQVIDEQNKTVPGAMILVARITDTAKKYNALSDSIGNFLVSNLDTGKYRLTLSFISYRTIFQDFYIGRDTIKMVNLGRLQLLPAKNRLKEVKVTAKRPFMTAEPDKTVFDADKIGAVSSGTASDLLAQIPLINIDQSGTVTIRGQAAGVLIDGKPSLTPILRQLWK
jgi:hypothetical protein